MAESYPSPDARLIQPSLYSRQEIVSLLSDYYKFLATLPHIDPSAIDYPPPEGWPEITKESLAERDISKSDEAVELLRHLPYFRGDIEQRFNWLAPECLACDWRIVSRRDLDELDPRPPAIRWLENNSQEKWPWPEWVVQLTSGRNQEEIVLLLDTKDGTVTRYSRMYHASEPTYPMDDPRSWRDRCCDETLPLREFLDKWQQKYVELEWVGMPSENMSTIRIG